MYKAILASVILGSMSVAQAADVKWSGDFGYRSDSLEIGNTNSDRDRFRVGLPRQMSMTKQKLLLAFALVQQSHHGMTWLAVR
jgi:hypothetical protein